MILAELEEQFAREYTPQDAVEDMRRDFVSDPAVVGLDMPESYLGTMMLEDDLSSVSVLVGSQEVDQPTYGLRHDYEQGRRALAFYKDFVKESEAAYDDDEALLALMMPVPDFPPYRPEYVDQNNSSRKFEAPLVRADYHTIMTTLNLVAPPLSISHHCDHVLSGWTAHPRRQHGERMFVGRSDATDMFTGVGMGEALGSYVRLMFNPLCPAGAAMVQRADYEAEHDRIRGHYEVRGKLYPFEYQMFEKKRYVVSSDEWIPRLGIQSFELMAFDLVSDEDFWPFGAKMYDVSRSRSIAVTDRLMPAQFRFVDFDPARPSYKQKTRIDGESGCVMHAGSSLVHRVEQRQVEEVLGEYVAIEPANRSARGFWIFEQSFDDQPTGLFTTLPKLTTQVIEPARWTTRQKLYVTYREGEKNAVKVSISDSMSVYVFRSKQKPLVSEASFAKEKGRVLINDYPLLGVWTNPQSSKLLFDLTYFAKMGVGRPARVFNTFFLHRGVYTNRQGCVAVQGVDILTYITANRETGRLRALNDMCGSPEWLNDDKFADIVANTIGRTESLTNDQSLCEYYARLFAPEETDE